MSAQLEHYHRKRAEMIQLLGGKCKHCETTENLEFDHVDPTQKKFTITKFYGLTLAKLMPELKKCQLLCKDCHLVKTREVDGFKAEHGSPGMYRHARCRCEPCKAAQRNYMNEYNRVNKDRLNEQRRARRALASAARIAS